MTQKTPIEVAKAVLEIYRNKELRGKKGSFILTSSAFKLLGGRENHRHAFGQQVKEILENDGFTLIDLHKNYQLIGIFRVSTLERKFDLLDEYDLDLV